MDDKNIIYQELAEIDMLLLMEKIFTIMKLKAILKNVEN